MTAHEEKLNGLMRSVQAGRIVHALLFTGPRGVGKRAAAERLAASLLCTGEKKPCGECPACKQIEAGTHPDLRIVSPKTEKKKQATNIRVDDIRALTEELALRSYAGGLRIAIIDPAQAMNEQAQNALLKTLENPHDHVMFILIAPTANALLPTIVSRCRELRFPPMNVEECTKALENSGMDAARARTLAGLSEGSPGCAKELDEDTRRAELSAMLMDSLELLLKKRPVAEAVCELAKLKRDEAEIVLDRMRLLARDLMALQNGAQAYDEVSARRVNSGSLRGTQLLQSVLKAEKMLASNVAWANVIGEMYLELI